MDQHNYSNSLIYYNYILIFSILFFFVILYTENPVPEFYKMAGLLFSKVFSGIGIRGTGQVFQITNNAANGTGGSILIITTTPPMMSLNANLIVNGSIINISPGSGVCNAAYGLRALDSLTTGSNNTAVGEDALTANTTASNNTAVGCTAGLAIISGIDNTLIGKCAGLLLTTGVQNTAVGERVLQQGVIANNNTAVGRRACRFVTGDSNVGIGAAALGTTSLSAILNRNVGVGSGALDSIITGDDNIALGHSAGGSLTLADSDNICIGNVGVAGDVGKIRLGNPTDHDETFLHGDLSLEAAVVINKGGSKYIHEQGGDDNFAAGSDAGDALDGETGTFNTLIGFSTGLLLTTGSTNTVVGERALQQGVTASNNTVVGRRACRNVTGDSNVAIGSAALGSGSTMERNVGIGTSTLDSIETGDDNIAIGDNAGGDLTLADSDNICIGNVGVAGDTFTTRIGTTQTKNFQAGITGVTTDAAAVACLVSGTGQLGTVSSSIRYKKDVEDIRYRRRDTTDILTSIEPS